MITQVDLRPISADDPTHIDAVAGLWTGACGAELPISPRFVTYNLRPTLNVLQNARFAWSDNEPIGFVIASTPTDQSIIRGATDSESKDQSKAGWINAIAVLPEMQGTGVGRKLLGWAEQWLLEQGVSDVTLGGNLRPFTPGLPSTVDTMGFFARHGYEATSSVWDVASNLSTYTPPAAVREIGGTIQPARPGQEQSLASFLTREFPGRWTYQFRQFLHDQERISDFMLLWTERGLDGFCQLTFEDSRRCIERFYPYQLPRSWGQLGPIGISADRRGQGYGAALIDAGLRRLHNNGVNGCVIDWTTLLDFYAKFGFEKYRKYVQLRKVL